MPISPARVAAFEILLRVERENAYASELLHSARYSKLSPTDHGLTMELVIGCSTLAVVARRRNRAFLFHEDRPAGC